MELFMQNVPVGSGMVFVVVQHVDPTHKGILPYRTLENMIDGVAVTFTDITASKTLEWKLRFPPKSPLELSNRPNPRRSLNATQHFGIFRES